MVTVCPNCSAELVNSPKECFICGHIFGTTADSQSPIGRSTSLGEFDHWKRDDLPSGFKFEGRFVVRHKQGVLNNWVWYIAVDAFSGEDCILQLQLESGNLSLGEAIVAAVKRTDGVNLFPFLLAGTSPCVFLLSPLQKGLPLSQIIQKQPPEETLLQWFGHILQGLDQAHSLGLANFALSAESIWISENGIAQLRLSDAKADFSSQVSEKDIRRAGILLYWMLSNGKPLIGKDLSPLYPRQAQLVRRFLYDECQPISEMHRLVENYSSQGSFRIAPERIAELQTKLAFKHLLCDAEILDFETPVLLAANAAFPTIYLKDGRILLETDGLALAEVGMAVDKPDPFGQLLIDRSVKDIDSPWAEPHTDVLTVVRKIRVACFTDDFERARTLLHQAQMMASHSEEWKLIAQIALFQFNDLSLFDQVIDNASQEIKDTYDAAILSGLCYWVGKTKKAQQFLSHGQRLAVSGDDWLLVAQCWLGMFVNGDEVNRAIENLQQVSRLLPMPKQFAIISQAIGALGKLDALLLWLDKMPTADATDILSRIDVAKRYDLPNISHYESERSQYQERLHRILDEIDVAVPSVDDIVSLESFVVSQQELASKSRTIEQQCSDLQLPIPSWEKPYAFQQLENQRFVVLREKQHRRHKQQARKKRFIIGLIIIVFVVFVAFLGR